MRNVLDKSCREYHKTHFTFSNFLSENNTVYDVMSSNIVETEGPQMTSQYGACALGAGLARLYARMHTHTRPGTYTHACMRKHAHTDQYVILTAFPQQQWFLRKRLSVTLYVHCLFCFVLFCFVCSQKYMHNIHVCFCYVLCLLAVQSSGCEKYSYS